MAAAPKLKKMAEDGEEEDEEYYEDEEELYDGFDQFSQQEVRYAQ